MSVYDWIDHVTVVTTLPLWVIGFAYTIYQVLQTKSASLAAQEAAERAVREIAARQGLILLPMLHKIEADLELAVDAADKRLVVFQLSLWRWHAGQLRQSLDLDFVEHKKLARIIQSSITHSGDAKMQLQDSTSPTTEATRKARKAIADVTGELGALAWASGTTDGGNSNV